MDDYDWSPDGTKLALASVSRDHKHARLRVADAATGAVRKVSRKRRRRTTNRARMARAVGHERIHLELASATTGGSSTCTTSPPARSSTQHHEGRRAGARDPQDRRRPATLWYGARAGTPPRIRTSCTSTGWSSTGKRRCRSRPTPATTRCSSRPTPGMSSTRTRSPTCRPWSLCATRPGSAIMPLEKADISKLLATGWKPPMPIKVKARDGKTDIYGLMFRPDAASIRRRNIRSSTTCTRARRPGSTGSRAFAAARGDRQALAELGFVVVTIDGMGTPGRSKSFQDDVLRRDGARQHDPRPDRRHEAARAHVSVHRHRRAPRSGATRAAASPPTDAMFRYPDFFKVGIAESGNHDQREYEDDWGERYQGLLAQEPGRHATTTTPKRTRTSRRTSRAICCSRTARWTTTCRRTRRCSWSTR